MAGTVCVLMNIDRKKGRVILGTRIGDSASKVKQLMEMESIDLPTQWADIREQISYCETAKNLLVHGVWMIDDGLLCVQDPSGEWKGGPPAISKRKYPEAFYPTREWFADLNEKMRHVIGDLQRLDQHIAAFRSR